MTYSLEFSAALRKKTTIHQVTTMLATSKNVLFPGHNHLLTTVTDDPTLWLLPERQFKSFGSSAIYWVYGWTSVKFCFLGAWFEFEQMSQGVRKYYRVNAAVGRSISLLHNKSWSAVLVTLCAHSNHLTSVCTSIFYDRLHKKTIKDFEHVDLIHY